jgi:hypothetical protein
MGGSPQVKQEPSLHESFMSPFSCEEPLKDLE